VATRERILRAAARLLSEGGAEALSTRAVSAAGGVQAPTLYRIFGDKEGLLDAVAAYGFAQYLIDKQSLDGIEDPVEVLRHGWDIRVDFGLTHPAYYVLLYGTVRPGRRPPAAEEIRSRLRFAVERAARAGRLRVPVEAATDAVEAAVTGVTLALIQAPENARDLTLSARVRDILLASLTTSRTPGPTADGDSLAVHALTLGAALAERPAALTPSETALLRDWLERLAVQG
jgi:AcrR family transcriptional regulator